jgi:two-component system nitrogen regulation response regulator GlnG
MTGSVDRVGAGLAASVEQHLRAYFAALGDDRATASDLYARIVHEVERPLLRLALAECRGNQLRAAELLGLNRNTLRKKLVELGLRQPNRRRFRALRRQED